MNSTHVSEYSLYLDLPEEIKFCDIIGQQMNVAVLKNMIVDALARDESADHILINGPVRSGKKTLALAVANEMHAHVRFARANSISGPGDFAAIVSVLEPGDVLVICEVENLKKSIIEVMIPAMRDFELDIKIGSESAGGRDVRLDLPPFTIVAITSDINLVDSDIRDLFGLTITMQPYTDEDMVEYITRESAKQQIIIESDSVLYAAKSSRRRISTASKLLKRLKDFGQANSTDNISLQLVEKILPNTNDEEIKNSIDSQRIYDQRYLDWIVDEYSDKAILNYVLENHYTNKNVSCEFLTKIVEEFEDINLLKRVLRNHFNSGIVDTNFLKQIVYIFADEDLLRSVMKNHCEKTAVTEEFLLLVIDELCDEKLFRFLLSYCENNTVGPRVLNKLGQKLKKKEFYYYVMINYFQAGNDSSIYFSDSYKPLDDEFSISINFAPATVTASRDLDEICDSADNIVDSAMTLIEQLQSIDNKNGSDEIYDWGELFAMELSNLIFWLIHDNVTNNRLKLFERVFDNCPLDYGYLEWGSMSKLVCTDFLNKIPVLLKIIITFDNTYYNKASNLQPFSMYYVKTLHTLGSMFTVIDEKSEKENNILLNYINNCIDYINKNDLIFAGKNMAYSDVIPDDPKQNENGNVENQNRLSINITTPLIPSNESTVKQLYTLLDKLLKVAYENVNNLDGLDTQLGLKNTPIDYGDVLVLHVASLLFYISHNYATNNRIDVFDKLFSSYLINGEAIKYSIAPSFVSADFISTVPALIQIAVRADNLMIGMNHNDTQLAAMILHFHSILGKYFVQLDGQQNYEKELLLKFVEKCTDYINANDNHYRYQKLSAINVFNDEVDYIQNSARGKNDAVSISEYTKPTPFEELNTLVGLDNIKQDVISLTNLVKIQQTRKNNGLQAVPVSLHLVFTGNPGTGKTTVARILAKIYKEIGVLKTGQLIEVDRANLVAGYVGQTALKTQEKINEALGGILFIDEAYTLVKDGNDFGQEAVDTILKAMEDHRDDLIVIVAGYEELMHRFINSNPGLKSRFNKYFNFPDYTHEELVEILMKMVSEYDYKLTESALKYVTEKITEMEREKDDNFANARAIRNYFEKIITKQASRVAMSSSLNNEDLTTIDIADVI